jgi:hypothetical protein
MKGLFRINLSVAVMAILFMLMAPAPPAFAAQRNMLVGWNANTDDTAIYRIYVNNAPIADIAGIATIAWTGAINLIEGSNKFELTALDAAGNESLRSDPCFFVFDGTAPAKPSGLKILLKP